MVNAYWLLIEKKSAHVMSRRLLLDATFSFNFSISISFEHILTHIRAMDLIFVLLCNPLNMLSNGVFYLTTYAFVHERQVEMYPYSPALQKQNSPVQRY